jgi:hypothetical protein
VATGFTGGSSGGAQASGQAGTDVQLVVYPYVISALFLSFKRVSGVKAIEPGQSRLWPGMPYMLATLFLGWWGIPWGPIWSVQTLIQNLRGGVEVKLQGATPVTGTPVVSWNPTHVAPPAGLPGWLAPDASQAPTTMIPGYAELVLKEMRGEWARVRTIDGWSGWVDARPLQLIARPRPY